MRLIAIALFLLAEGPVSAQAFQPVAFKPLTGRMEKYAPNGAAGPYYPERARSAGKSGVALLDCQVAAGGALSRCSVVSESPERYDFGAAALAMARDRWMVAAAPFEVGRTVRVEAAFAPAP